MVLFLLNILAKLYDYANIKIKKQLTYSVQPINKATLFLRFHKRRLTILATTETLNTLKIHKLSQAQYDREKEAGRLDDSAIYLTPESDGSAPSNMVTTDTEQTISGDKIFTGTPTIQDANPTLDLNGNPAKQVRIFSDSINIFDSPSNTGIRYNTFYRNHSIQSLKYSDEFEQGGYVLTFPDTSGTIATQEWVGQSSNASSHKAYYNTLRDIKTVWGDNNGAIIVIPEGTTKIATGAYQYNKSAKVVAIPDSVTSIGLNAFYNCDSLTSVVIPDSVTSIGSNAFSSCDSLTSVSIGNSVASIGNYAFSGCNNLTSVEIYDGVTSIGDSAFRGCTSLTSIEIPDSVTMIGDEAFNSCTNLQYTIKDNIKYLGNQNNPYRYLVGVASKTITSASIDEKCKVICDDAFDNCSSLTSVIIPDSVTHIGESPFPPFTKFKNVYITDIEAWCNISFGGINDYAPYTANPFYYAKNLYLNNELVSELIIPNTVTEIKDCAFSGCDSLTSVTIPDSVTSIGDYAFNDCSSLTSVAIPSSVTSINKSTFCDCKNLTSIVLPDSITSIGEYAFMRCSNLPNIAIPDNVTSIGESAFFACTKLTDVEISSNVNSIGESAFSSCNSLSTITVDANNPVYKSIDNVLYTIDGRTLMQYAPAKPDTSFTIPNSVTSISHRAFDECANLTSIAIPNGVTSIGSHAFYWCDNLASVVIGNGITNISDYMFYGCSKLKNVVIGSSVTNIDTGAFTSIGSGAVITIRATTPPAINSDGSAVFDSYIGKIIVPEESLQAYCGADGWRDFISIIEDTAGNKVNVGDFSEIPDLINSDLATNLADGGSAYVTLSTDVDVMWANENSNVAVVNNSNYSDLYLAVDLSDSNLDEWTDHVQHSDNLVFSGDDLATLRREGGTLILKPSRIDDFSENVAEWSDEEVVTNFPMYETYTQLDDEMSMFVEDNHMPRPVALKLTESNIGDAVVVDDDFFGIKLLDDDGDDPGDYIYIYRHTSGNQTDGPYEGYLDELPSPDCGWGNCAIYGYMMQWPNDGDKVMYPICICRLDENDNPMEMIGGQ